MLTSACVQFAVEVFSIFVVMLYYANSALHLTDVSVGNDPKHLSVVVSGRLFLSSSHVFV